MSKTTVPIWLPDETHSGIFVYWQNLLKYLPGEDVIFVSDAPDAADRLEWPCLRADSFRSNADSYTLPLFNLGVSHYYCKQLDHLFSHGGLVFFHQLYLQRLVYNYFLRFKEKDVPGYINYGRIESGHLGQLLAELSAVNGLLVQEYYCRTFAHQICTRSVGIASSWKGALGCLQSEGMELQDNCRFHYVPPLFDADHESNIRQIDFATPKDHRHWRFALLGHRSELKNPAFALDLIRELNRQGVPSQLVAIGTIGEMVRELTLPGDHEFVFELAAPTHADFLAAVDSADFVLHLRHPFGGEMAATVCEGMARGLPVVGYYKDWLTDLPEEACIGLPYPASPKEASGRVAEVLKDPSALAALRKCMDSYLRSHGRVAGTVSAIRSLLSTLRGGRRERRASVRSTATQ